MSELVDWDRILPRCVNREFSHLKYEGTKQSILFDGIAEFYVFNEGVVEFVITVEFAVSDLFEVILRKPHNRESVFSATMKTPHQVIEAVKCASRIAIAQLKERGGR